VDPNTGARPRRRGSLDHDVSFADEDAFQTAQRTTGAIEAEQQPSERKATEATGQCPSSAQVNPIPAAGNAAVNRLRDVAPKTGMQIAGLWNSFPSLCR
jgi:hypothetical protein